MNAPPMPARMPAEPEAAGALAVSGFYHAATSSVSYVIADPASGSCAILDPVLDYDARSGRTGSAQADLITRYVREQGLRPEWILETHAHADHLSAAQLLKQRFDAPVAIGEHIRRVQHRMKRLYNLDETFATDGSQFDRLFADGDFLRIGHQLVRVLHTPGHTPACVSYVTDGAAFIGDTLFMPDYGTARCDFPGGSAGALYRSIQRLYALPAETRLYLCHDYPPGGRAPAWETTVAEQRRDNIHLRDGVDEAAFVQLREARDHALELPALILPALQVNIRAGRLPEPEANGIAYLKIPLNVFN